MPAKGWHHSEESRRKLREAQRGHPISLETRAKISAALRGRKFSEETRTKLSDAKRDNQHRTTHGMRHTPEYQTWLGMLARCHGVNAVTESPYYAGRGIAVCSAWRESFAAFYEHIGPKPSPEHSIDRVDVNGNYEPGNVRWATRSEQRRNQRRSRANRQHTQTRTEDELQGARA